MASDIEKSSRGSIRPLHGVVLVVVGVVGVIVAFWVLGAIAGFLWGFVKIVVLIAIVLGVLWLLVGRRR
jgi:hypothetical protein